MLVVGVGCGPPAPWIEVVGAAECVHRVARDPTSEAPQMRWEAGCPGDAIAGCERLVTTAGPGRLDGVNGVQEPVMVLDVFAESGSTTGYYAEDGRALMFVRTDEGTAECRGELAFAGGRVALLSTGGARQGYAPAMFSAPFPGTAGWRGARAVYGERKIGDAMFAPLADGRAVLVQHDVPEVFVVGAGDSWGEALAADLDVVDAALLGEQVALLADSGELRIVSIDRGPITTYKPAGRQIGALRGDGRRIYWLELPEYVDHAEEPDTVSVELRAAEVVAGEPLVPRVLASFPHLRRFGFFDGIRAFHSEFHSPSLPHVGVGPGGVYVHVGRDAEDLMILVRPSDEKAWAWRIGGGQRTPGLGAQDSVREGGERAPTVEELRSVVFVGEQWLALSYAHGMEDVRRYPLAGFQAPEAALGP